MKIPFLVPVLVIAAQIAGAATFNLPKDGPLFSIALPDDWQTGQSPGGLSSHPPGDNKFVVNLFALPDVHTRDAAMSAAVERTKQTLQQFSPGEAKNEIEAGIGFIGMSAKGTKDGAPMRITIIAFASDSEHYFGLSLAGEEASFPKYGDAHDQILESIRPVRHLKTEVEPGVFAIGCPDENPLFAVPVPAACTIESDSNQFVAKAKNGLSMVRITAVPASDAALLKDDDARSEWAQRKAAELVKTSRLDGYVPRSTDTRQVANHWAAITEYIGPYYEELITPFAVCVFTPDGKRYYYACWESRDTTGEGDPQWGLETIKSIKTLTK